MQDSNVLHGFFCAANIDRAANRAVNYEYDSLGRLIHSSAADANGITMLTEHLYDRANRLKQQSWQLRNGDGTYKTYTEGYTYRSSDGAITKLTPAIGNALNFTYDTALSRLIGQSNSIYNKSYTYRNISGSQTTNQIQTVSYAKGASNFSPFTLEYAYDELGNIISVSSDEITSQNAEYEYDNQGQLITETVNDVLYEYKYDTYGNLRGIFSYEHGLAPVHRYTFGDADWKDLITAVDGELIVYDAIGNPKEYYNGTHWDFTWAKGRQLTKAVSEDYTINYTYDLAGIRDSKTVNGVTYNYLTLSGKVVRQTWNDNEGDHTIDFAYDNSGNPYAFTYDGTTYYYVLNQQGDVIRIVDTTGSTVAEYQYNAWGKLISTQLGNVTNAETIAKVNPLRYRGYYYDAETGMYYLQSRYYDPEICRFINADAATFIGANSTFTSYNLFSYCLNNPVNNTDDGGTLSLPNWAKVAIGVGIIAAAAAITVATGGAAAGTIVAAVNCVAHGALVGAVTQGAIGAVSGAASGAISHRITTGSWEGAGQAAVDGAATGFMTGTITGAITGGMNSPYCFVAGTTVLTAAGAAAIETIQAGDMVWAWDEETGEVALKEVVETYVNETDELIHVFVNGEEIITTPSHPFYSPVKGWTDAVRLRAGDILVLVNGEYVVVEKVQHEILEAPITVYNFQVEDYHTYYVTDTGVLVHNSCAHQSKEWRNIRRDYWKQQAATQTESPWYELSIKNLDLMSQGKAPIGYDGERVVLHHVKGIANDIYDFVEIGGSAHRAFHKMFGYKNFIDIFAI